MKRTLIFSLAILAMVLSASVGLAETKKDYSASSNAVSEIQAADQLETAQTFERLRKAVPPPKPTTSLERQQLVKRLERFNVADKISYIYLIDFGKIMGFFNVKGKVSSVNSKLTCTQQLVYDGKGTGNSNGGRDGVHVVESPALDGSFGSNGNAIFFFTDIDVYVEWNGIYMLCDQYLSLDQPPELVMEVE